MKVVAFNGSARKDGNTAILIRRVLSVLESEEVETELIQMAGQQIHGCTACGTCQKIQNKQCKIVNDNVNIYIEKMAEADGIILGSPTYFSMMTSEMKALIDRAGFVGRTNGDMFKRKVGAASSRCSQGRRYTHLRRYKPLFSHKPNDSSRVILLERRHRFG